MLSLGQTLTQTYLMNMTAALRYNMSNQLRLSIALPAGHMP